jgi:hypothetical protein
MQADTEQRPHKISFHIEKNEAQKIVPELTAAFEQEKVRINYDYLISSTIDAKLPMCRVSF